MLRAVSKLYREGPALERLVNARRDVSKCFRSAVHSSSDTSKTVLASDTGGRGGDSPPPPASSSPPPPTSSPPPPTSSPPPPTSSPPPPTPPQRARTYAAAALALTASLGGAYLLKRLNDDKLVLDTKDEAALEDEASPPAHPARGEQFPPHVQYLIVGGGTAAFAALRAIRSNKPTAQVLVVTEERALPYMRPPLSKEVWQQPDLLASSSSSSSSSADRLTFRQWNGKQRNITYEPEAFYTPVERLAATVTPPEATEGRETAAGGRGGVGVARGWRVTELDVPEHTASITLAQSEGDGDAVTVKYDKCLIATGSTPRRVPVLAAAAAAGRAVTLRTVSDARRVARVVTRDAPGTVVVLGGGFLATELTAALANALDGSKKRVVQIFREEAAMAHVLPSYLAGDVTDRLREHRATILTDTEVTGARVEKDRVILELSRSAGAAGVAGQEAGDEVSLLEAELVVECVGAEPDTRLARPSSLEEDQHALGLVVNAELMARSDVYAAGDVAAFYDPLLGRRRLQHHDHAVVSGRLAGDNMAGRRPPRHYHHQSMFWSDLGPHLGYEAIGIIDSKLPTVGVFSAEAVTRAGARAGAGAGAGSGAGEEVQATGEGEGQGEGEARGRYARGVVFYLRERRVVGVLLYNLFNRLHTARQVLAAGEFDDLLEVGKLFAPQLDD